MADDDLTFTTGDVSGTAVQAHTIHGNVYLQPPPLSETPCCAPPATWSETTDLPAAVADLLWAQQKTADLLPYQLPHARTPALGTIYVRQDLGGGVEDAPDGHSRPTPMLDERGRLVEIPVVKSVRVAVRPPAKQLRAALDTDPHLLVLGGPGQGKSTLTLRLSAEIADHWAVRTDDNAPLSEPVVPLRITARTFAQHLGSSFAEALADSAYTEHGRYLTARPDPALFAGRVAGCRWLLLVDALDEVTDSALRATLVHTLAAWASRDVHRVLLTTRPTEGGALASLQRAKAARYELQPFDAEALRLFAHNWFEELGEDHADRFLHQIREAHLDELVEVPLLATIAAIVFEQYRDRPLPGNQYELYESYLGFLRTPHRADEAFDRYRKELVGHLGRTRLTTESSLTAAAQDWARYNDVPDVEGLIAYLLDVGPFVKRGNDITFLHHSFAEHVAATAMAGDLPERFDPQQDAFAELLHEAYPEESGTFPRAVLLHYTHLHPAEADRVLGWLHEGGSEEHLLGARLLGRHLPASTQRMDEFLATVRAWAMTTRYPARLILRETSRATRHPGLIEWLADLMHTETAPWESRAEAAVALAVRLRCEHTDAATALLRAVVDNRRASVKDRLLAAEALAHSGSAEREAGERGLRLVLADRNASGADHRSAAVVLSGFDSSARAFAIAALVRLMTDPDTPPADLVEAATGLLEIDADFQDRCAEVFLLVLEDPVHSFTGRHDAAVGLVSIGRREQAAEVLTTLMNCRDFPIGHRAQAVMTMAALGAQHRLVADRFLLSYLDNPFLAPIDGLTWVSKLAQLGHRERAVSILRDILTDPTANWSFVGSAVYYFADLGPGFREEVAAHAEHILSCRPSKGYEYTLALRSLAELGEPHRARAVVRMWALLTDPDADPATRCDVASDLIRFSPERYQDIAGQLIAIMRAGCEPQVSVTAWSILVLFGPELRRQGPSAMISLAKKAHDCDHAPFALGRTFGSLSAEDCATAASVLRAIAKDEGRGVRNRMAAVRGLQRLGREFHRPAAELLRDLITAGEPVNLTLAASTFVETGRGVRAIVAEALCEVIRTNRLSVHRVWSAVQGLGTLGERVSDDVLHAVLADGSVLLWRRLECARMLAHRDEAFRPVAIDLHDRESGNVGALMWHSFAFELARPGADVRGWLQAMVVNPDKTCQVRAAIASLLGRDGVAELRRQAEDPYLDLEIRSEAYRFLVAIDHGVLPEAVAFHRAVMDDPDEPIRGRCDIAWALTRLDRPSTPVVISALWRWAESPLLVVSERARAVIVLFTLDDPPSPRFVQLAAGLCQDPALGGDLRARLAKLLSRSRRVDAELALLADHTVSLADRVPKGDPWGYVPLAREAEVVVREVLTDPVSSRSERRQAAVELARLSERHVPEALGVLLEDGSPAALTEVAKLGGWPQVLERVLDASAPWRDRLATVLRISGMSSTPAVREMLAERQSRLSWRDRVDVLACLERHDELRALRDDCAALPAQRCRAASKLVEFTSADRVAAAGVYRMVVADPEAAPQLRVRVARDLAKLGARGRAEAVSLMLTMAADEKLPVLARSGAANWLRINARTNQADMLELQRELASAAGLLQKVYLLRSISWAPAQDAVDELLRMAADRELTPRIRLWCVRSVVERRRDLRDRCAVVAREIAFDVEAPWHIRVRAARCLARWSEVMRADARALLGRLRDCAAR